MADDEEFETACRKTVAQKDARNGAQEPCCRQFHAHDHEDRPRQNPRTHVLDQVFTASAPNQKWVTDITYLPTAADWVYLSVVLDLFGRKVVGWSMSQSLAKPLVSEARRKAIELPRPIPGELLHHSDRGCQYTSDVYRGTLRSLGIECSMSRTACCHYNAVMERFFWSLKHEWTRIEAFADLQEAQLSVFEYIKMFYNTVCIHQTLGYKTPDEFEALHESSLAS